MERARAYSRSYRATRAGRERGRRHMAAYRSLFAEGHELFREVMAPGETIPLNELRNRLAGTVGVAFRPETLKNANEKLGEERGKYPLVDVGEGCYRLNETFEKPEFFAGASSTDRPPEGRAR